MNDKTTDASIKVEDPEVLDLCRQVKALRKEGREATEQLNQRYRDEADAMNAAFEKRNDELWQQLYAKLGIDPDARWTIDTEYLDAHGVAFVKPDEECDCGAPHHGGGLADLLGGLMGGGVASVRISGAELEPADEPTIN